MSKTDFKESYSLILSEVNRALDSVDSESVEKLVDTLINAKKVFLVGVGRVAISLEAFVKRLNHFGIKAYMVGALDEPAITAEDVLIVGSGSGSSVVPVAIAKVASKYNPTIVHIGSNPEGGVAPYTTYMVRIPVKTKLNKEDEIPSEQIMSSLFEQALYVLCDSICLMIAKKKGVDDLEKLWECHANLE